MDMENIVNDITDSAAEETVENTEIAEENPVEEMTEEIKPKTKNKRKKRYKRWPTIVITAFITMALTLVISTFLFFKANSTYLNLAVRYSKFYEIEMLVKNNYIGEIDSSQMLDGAASGLIDGIGDQWSYYMTAEEVSAQEENRTNSYVGIGIRVQKPENEYLTVSEVIADGGAYAAGIMAGDLVVAVEGIDVLNLSLDDVTAMIKGNEGTYVQITIQRGENRFDVTVERRRIAESSIEYEMISDVGYIRILNFFDNTSDDFKAAVEELISEGAVGLVFDVRFNGGGYLRELYPMLDYILPEGVIFRTEDKAGETYTQESDAACVDMPIAVLINDMSISAAEYFAAVIREYEWGTLVGMPTVGKGYSQNVFYLSDGSAVNLSTMKYFTPNGVCLAGVGLTPDVEVEIEYEEYLAVYQQTVEYDNDTQLQAAINAVKD